LLRMVFVIGLRWVLTVEFDGRREPGMSVESCLWSRQGAGSASRRVCCLDHVA
jgi:hypothetical protein